MHSLTLSLVAGMLSTTLFVISYLPMLTKAARTRDLASYSVGNLLIANVGNAVHSLYVFSLPVGPIWFLHTFYLLSTAMMLFWFWRYRTPRAPAECVHTATEVSADGRRLGPARAHGAVSALISSAAESEHDPPSALVSVPCELTKASDKRVGHGINRGAPGW